MTSLSESPRAAGGWSQKYPPLLAMGVAVLIALVVLPSTLNLPQTNPTETLEYAPVPPDENDDSPPEGNVSALGLGSSSAIEGEGAGGADGPGGGPPPPPPDEPGGAIDGNFRCVGNPPRQTEDPLAPPCVPFFEGDNGGATYQGVTANEVRLLVALEGGITYISGSDASNQQSPTDQIYDLAQTAEECRANHSSSAGCTHLAVRGLRVWQKFFNDRFQTYGRRVRFFVAFSGGAGATPERRRAEAATHLSEVDPFAVVSFYTEGAEDAYLRAMASKGVLNFGSYGLRDATFFNTFARMIWSYLPSIEQQAGVYISYVCQKAVPHPAVLAEGSLNGQPRRFGLIHTTDEENHPGLVKLAQTVRQGVTDCGGEIVETATFKNCCLAHDGGDSPTDEAQQMATFQQRGVTTILWPGGANGNYARSMPESYRPEWILLGGDGFLDNPTFVTLSQSGPTWDGHAITITPHILQPALEQQRCFQFFREIDKNYSKSDLGYVCSYYEELFQFFVAVQVAGPYLGPTQVDKGFHAIPQRYTGDPFVPACFYLPGDYTCIKDAAAQIWSQSDTPPGGSQPGCFLAIEGGRRYGPDRWPAGNLDAQMRPDDPCTGYSQSARFNPT